LICFRINRRSLQLLFVVYKAIKVLMLPLPLEVSVMTMLQTEPVYTISEVASALKLSSETVRRRITSGELHAIEIGGLPRRQYRILARDLAAWIGEDAAKAVFGIGHGLDALQAAFADLEPKARTALIDEGQTWARAKTDTPAATGRSVSREEISKRFPKK
jgi:excisionase family DNA binding protein